MVRRRVKGRMPGEMRGGKTVNESAIPATGIEKSSAKRARVEFDLVRLREQTYLSTRERRFVEQAVRIGTITAGDLTAFVNLLPEVQRRYLTIAREKRINLGKLIKDGPRAARPRRRRVRKR